jgi:DNA-binding NarL/FixJ family response regulator
LNVLIIENSDILKERYTRLLSSINSIEMLTLTALNVQSFDFIKNHNPEVIIIAQDLNTNIKIDIIKKIKENNSATIIISLCSKPFHQINEKYKEIGADYILDKSTEFNKLYEIFQELNTNNIN